MASGTPADPRASPSPSPSPSERPHLWRPMLPSVAMMGAMAVALVLALGPGLAWSQAALITSLTALALLMVGVSLFESMGLRREPLSIRLVILVPLALTLVITVALMLDAHFRGPGLGDRALG